MNDIARYIRERMELLRIMPDLSLRLTFIVVACCLVVSAYMIGEIRGRSAIASEQLSATMVLPFVPYDPARLKQDGVPYDTTVVVAHNFVASANGKLFYPANCKSAARIKEENRIWFATAEEAKRVGLIAAKNCTSS